MPSVHLFLFLVRSVWYFYKVLHAAVNYENFSDERRETIEIVDDVFPLSSRATTLCISNLFACCFI